MKFLTKYSCGPAIEHDNIRGGVFSFANVTVWDVSILKVLSGSKNKFLGKFLASNKFLGIFLILDKVLAFFLESLENGLKTLNHFL